MQTFNYQRRPSSEDFLDYQKGKEDIMYYDEEGGGDYCEEGGGGGGCPDPGCERYYCEEMCTPEKYYVWAAAADEGAADFYTNCHYDEHYGQEEYSCSSQCCGGGGGDGAHHMGEIESEPDPGVSTDGDVDEDSDDSDGFMLEAHRPIVRVPHSRSIDGTTNGGGGGGFFGDVIPSVAVYER